MNADMIDLIDRLEKLSQRLYAQGGFMPSQRQALKEAIVRLVSMDAQILMLQAKLEERDGPH